MYQKASLLPRVTLLPSRSAEKKPTAVSCQNCERSSMMPALRPSNTDCGTPSGLSGPRSINGVMAESRTTERTRSVPCRPM